MSESRNFFRNFATLKVYPPAATAMDDPSSPVAMAIDDPPSPAAMAIDDPPSPAAMAGKLGKNNELNA